MSGVQAQLAVQELRYGAALMPVLARHAVLGPEVGVRFEATGAVAMTGALVSESAKIAAEERTVLVSSLGMAGSTDTVAKDLAGAGPEALSVLGIDLVAR